MRAALNDAKDNENLEVRYAPRVVEWIDTKCGLEKQAAVILLVDPPTIVVVFRGSKKMADYFYTGSSLFFTPIPTQPPPLPPCSVAPQSVDAPPGSWELPWPAMGQSATAAAPEDAPLANSQVIAAAALGPEVEVVSERQAATMEATATPPATATAEEAEGQQAATRTAEEAGGDSGEESASVASRGVPSCTSGLWGAYAGSHGRAAFSPRSRVRAAVERLLSAHPHCRLCLAGHSLGGALATLCAYDLLTTSAMAAASHCTLLSYGSPRSFNTAFRHASSRLEHAGRLFALRVECEGDVVPQLPPRPLGMVAGTSARLVLRVSDAAVPLRYSYRDSDVRDDDERDGWDFTAHTCHAIYLAGETTPGRQQTVPLDAAWPLVLASPPEGGLPWCCEVPAEGSATRGDVPLAAR